MLNAGLRLFALPLVAAALCAAAPGTYQDPQGRFSVPVPPGWTATAGDGGVRLTSGNAYALLILVDGGGADPRLVSSYADQFGQQWRDYRRVQTGKAQLGTAAGTFAIYTGTNPRGIEAIVKAVGASAGNGAVLLLSSCPVNEWEDRKASIESMERGLRIGGAVQTNAPATGNGGARGGYASPVAASPAVRGGAAIPPPGNGPAPNGFKVAGRSGQVGQALTATFTGGRSAKATFRSAFRLAGAYFDQPPALRAAVVDARDELVEALFRATWQGAPVRGLMVTSIGGGAGYVGMVFDREDQFSRSLPVLSRQMGASLPAQNAGQGGQAQAPARPRAPQPLTQTTLTDGSGWIGLPAGWRIAGAYKGTVDATGPDNSFVSLGGYHIAFTNPIGGPQPGMMTGPFRDPVNALPLMMDTTILQGALRSGRMAYKMIEYAPVPSTQGQAAYIAFRIYNQQLDYRYLAMVQTAPVDNIEWFCYSSLVGAPTNKFAEVLPTLWAIWKSWNVNPAVFKERMDAALQSMRDTYEIYRGIDQAKQRATEIGNRGWDQVIRGVTTIQNISTGERQDIDNNSLNFLQSLGMEGSGFKVLSPADLQG